jgi:putative Mg2+ transporter-C (MgtC) family protein
MPTHIEWSAIALRLALTAVASAAIGINRGELDRPVGLRTTMLVALAAAIAMIQVNLLLPSAGKPSDSFVMLDLMRLPLGVLSGMGFIGAGAIVRRNDLVQGVTTAATLWYVTMMGLCFGGGQLVLGLAALGLALVVLWCLKWVERRYIDREHRAELVCAFEAGAAIEQRLKPQFFAAGFVMQPCSATFSNQGQICTMQYEVRCHAAQPAQKALDLVHELSESPGVIRIEWRTIGRP